MTGPRSVHSHCQDRASLELYFPQRSPTCQQYSRDRTCVDCSPYLSLTPPNRGAFPIKRLRRNRSFRLAGACDSARRLTCIPPTYSLVSHEALKFLTRPHFLQNPPRLASTQRAPSPPSPNFQILPRSYGITPPRSAPGVRVQNSQSSLSLAIEILPDDE